MRSYLFRTPSILKNTFKDLTWEIESGQEQHVYLTFDDGPCPIATPVVLRVLRHFNIKATFFCVGENVKKHPDILKDILDAGHVIGNHTYHHVSGWSMSTKQYLHEVDLCHQVLSNYLDKGIQPLFRPPYGRITKKQYKAIKHSHEIIMWSYLSGDFDRNLNIRASIKAMAQAKEGAIFVFHDNVKHLENMEKVLLEFVPQILSKGFKFALLTKND